MGRESRWFGSATLSPRELSFLRIIRLQQVLGMKWLKFRYRDRLHFGPGCRVDYKSVFHSGLGEAALEEGVLIDRGIHRVCFHLESGSRVTLGRGTWVQTFDDDLVFSCKAGAEIRIGAGCWFSGGIFGASKLIEVGERTLIGWGCMILDSDLHRLDNDSPPVAVSPVRIGSHVWMPSNITVLKGVEIGDHSVIGTGSLVTESIPDHSFAAGRPARVIRRLGDRDRVE